MSDLVGAILEVTDLGGQAWRVWFSQPATPLEVEAAMWPGGCPLGVSVTENAGVIDIVGITSEVLNSMDPAFSKYFHDGLAMPAVFGTQDQVQAATQAATADNYIPVIHIWLKAFIQDYAVNSPGLGLYKGDNRRFSADSQASARMTSFAYITTADGVPQLNQYHYCDRSDEITDTGDILRSDVGDDSRMHFDDFEFYAESRVMTFSYVGAAENPLVRASPDIDMNGQFHIDLSTRQFTAAGAVDAFPAFEGYVSFDGAVHTMFQVEEGDSPLGLPGGANRPFHCIIEF